MVFTAAAAMALTGALVSSLRGGQYYYQKQEGPPSPHGPDTTAAPTRTATRTGMGAGRFRPAQQVNSSPTNALRRPSPDKSTQGSPGTAAVGAAGKRGPQVPGYAGFAPARGGPITLSG